MDGTILMPRSCVVCWDTLEVKPSAMRRSGMAQARSGWMIYSARERRVSLDIVTTRTAAGAAIIAAIMKMPVWYAVSTDRDL